MSTDTAFALGMLALVGRRLPDRLRAFLLTFSVVDDVAALVVIAVVYSDRRARDAAADRRRCCWRSRWRCCGRGVRFGAVYLLLGRRRLGRAATSPASTRSSSAWPWAC